MKRKSLLFCLLLLSWSSLLVGAQSSRSAVTLSINPLYVKVAQCCSVDGNVALFTEVVSVSTETPFTSLSAPHVEGYRFVGWEIDDLTNATFVARDAKGRAFECVTFTPTQETTLTARYEVATLDCDGDQIADADELYWYGALIQDDDSDGDNLSFREELAMGTNPHLPNTLTLGGVEAVTTGRVLYNPCGYPLYTLRSEPEGVLFTTRQMAAAPGTMLPLPVYTLADGFAYWTVNGIPQRDVYGVALTRLSVEMPMDAVEIVAHTMSDDVERLVAYWGVTEDADSDDDYLSDREELLYGTHPRLTNSLVLGGVAAMSSNKVLYNPNALLSTYVIRSNPASIFAEETGTLKPGEQKLTQSYASDATFAYWTLNGIRQSDASGRALDRLTLTGAAENATEYLAVAHFVEGEGALEYWYVNRTDITTESDTDHDGLTFSEEMANGLNPLFTDTINLGGVAYGSGAVLETDLQSFDMGEKVLIDDALVSLFTSSLNSGEIFNGAVAVATLLNSTSDRFDFFVATTSGITRYRSMGVAGAPNFKVEPDVYPVLSDALATYSRPVLCAGEDVIWFCDNGGGISRYDIKTATISGTAFSGYPMWSATDGLAIYADGRVTFATGVTREVDDELGNFIPTAAVLAEVSGDTLTDLLVADSQGRIHFYERVGDRYVLRYRVWGGTYAGFAEGLTLAPVDWEGDGDTDMLCGTGDGKLLLLSDPGVGVPTNFYATAGYDNVLLNWDPNTQSRVYGYNLYRTLATEESFKVIASPALPTYRDEPGENAWASYRVTALSRLWQAGNSTPEIFESRPSASTEVQLGSVTLALPGGDALIGETLEAVLTIDNAKGVGAQDFALTVTYDPAVLEPLEILPTALTEGVEVETILPEEGIWRITASTGTLVPGSGEMFRLRFAIRADGPCSTELTLKDAILFSTKGAQVAVNLPKEESVFTLSESEDPPCVDLLLDGLRTQDGYATITITLAADEALDWSSLILDLFYDEEVLRLESASLPTAENPCAVYTFYMLNPTLNERFATVEVSGTAQTLGGQPVQVGTVAADIPLNAPETHPVVTLNAKGVRVKKPNDPVKIRLFVTTAGEPLDWESLEITPHYDENALTLLSDDTEIVEGDVVDFFFTVRPGKERTLTIDFTGEAKSISGKRAIVKETSCDIVIEERHDYCCVPPWKMGDCNGDGYLTEEDYQIAFDTVKTYHPHGLGKPPASHDETARKIHASICGALRKHPNDRLHISDIANSFKKYLRDRGVRKRHHGHSSMP